MMSDLEFYKKWKTEIIFRETGRPPSFSSDRIEMDVETLKFMVVELYKEIQSLQEKKEKT